MDDSHITYRIETFPHYQTDSIISWSEDIGDLKIGINVVYLIEGRPSYINVREATEEERHWLSQSTHLKRVEIYQR